MAASGGRGRPPRPAEQKERIGRSAGRDSGGRPLPEVVVELPRSDAIPETPAELLTAGRAGLCAFAEVGSPCQLCAEDLAAAAWRELWTHGQSWLSMQRDRRILLRLCKAYAEEAHLRATLAEDGPFVKGQRGGLVAHPAVAMLRVLEQQITRWEGLCGFNPSDGGRAGVKVAKRGTSPLEDLLLKRAADREQRARAAQRPAAKARAAGTD